MTKVALIYLGDIGSDTGGRTYLSEILRPLGQDRRLEIDIHLGDPGFDVPTGSKRVVHRVPHRLGPLARVAAENVLARTLSRRGYDVLLAPFNVVPFAWDGPSVVVQHSVLTGAGASRTYSGHLKTWYRRRAVASTVTRAHEIVAVSNHLADLLVSWYPRLDRTRIRVAPLAPARALMRAGASRSPRQEPVTLLVVSALWPHKRVDQAISVLAALLPRFPDARLEIAGPGKANVLHALQSQASALGVGNRVVFLGNLPHGELARHYHGAHAVLALSEAESFGLPLLEAMALGVPVVAREIDAFTEIGGDVPVWVRKSAGVPEVVAALERLLNDETSSEMRRQKGMERAALFTWERTAEETAEAVLAAAARH